jgi:hypothetical protein
MRILVIAALSLHLAPTAVHAQAVADDTAATALGRAQSRWDGVRALPAGARLEIENLAGEFLEGRVRSVSEVGIMVDTKKATVDVPRPSVGRVILIGSRRTGPGARRGFLIGAAVGVAVTAIGRAPIAWMLFIGSGWGGLGAALGAADGARVRERVVIYQREAFT